MLDVIFNAVVFFLTGVIAVMPIFSLAAVWYIYRLYKQSVPPNEVLKILTITGSMVSLGGTWWSFVAVRRMLLGGEAAVLPDVFIIVHALALIFILITPVIKAVRLTRLMSRPVTEQQIEDMRRLEYDLIANNQTVNEAEDERFGNMRRELEEKHIRNRLDRQ